METDTMLSDVIDSVNSVNLSTLNFYSVLRIVVLILVGIIVIRILMTIVDHALARSKAMKVVGKYIRSVVNVVLWFLLVLVVADSLGIPVTSFIALLSVAGLAVSLALQNTLANLAGGIMVLMSKPFDVGDYVEVDGTGGTVEAIGLAYSTLATVDNKEIFIPNSQVSAAKIVNFTRLGTRRVDLVFSASYDASTETVKKALGQAMSRFPQIKSDPAPQILLSKYGESSIEYTVRLWVSGDDYWDVYFGMMEQVRSAFADNSVEMTYNHLNVHMVEK